jgi:hypothetical protein
VGGKKDFTNLLDEFAPAEDRDHVPESPCWSQLLFRAQKPLMFTDISSVAAELGDVYFPTAYIYYRIFRFDSLFHSICGYCADSLLGMNVDIFENNPNLKYYFITVVPFMLLVLLAWFVFKQFLRVNPQLLLYAGIYERFYDEMATMNLKL